jgi:RimJ/RimL family protein N-acetyltransferase
MPLMPSVTLRELTPDDLDAVFAMTRDPEAVWMAAFTRSDPDDRAAFDAHQERLSADPSVVQRAVLLDGRLVGTISSFVLEGDTEVTYWIDRAAWGQGVASRALEGFLLQVPTRPVFGRAASDNAASLRVLEKAGFAPVGSGRAYAAGRRKEVEETVLRLD